MSLDKQIQKEMERVSEELNRLKQENLLDAEVLEDLKEDYNAAIISGDESEIDSVNEHIKQVQGRINRRNDKINALQLKNNPTVQQLILDNVQKWLDEKTILEQQVKDKVKELQPIHKELQNELEKLAEINKRVITLKQASRRYLDQLNDNAKKKIKFDPYESSKVPEDISSLLIERSSVFKVG